MKVGDKVTWEKHHYYIMEHRVNAHGNDYYVITLPNKDGSKPKVRRIDKTDIAFEHELQEGWI